jgi:hypothetical protein
MKDLEQLIKTHYASINKTRNEGNELLARLRLPLTEIIEADKRTEETRKLIKKRIEKLKRREHIGSFDVKSKFATLSMPVNLSTTTFNPPYNFDWTTGGGDANVNASANKNGQLSCSVSAGNQNGYASAGVAVIFRPSRSGFITFVPIVGYNFNWLDLANFIDASSSAFFGVYVQEYNLQGEYIGVNSDNRQSLWNDTAGWLNEDSDSGNGVLINYSVPVEVDSELIYVFWTWFSTSANNGWNCFSESNISSAFVASMRFNTD